MTLINRRRGVIVRPGEQCWFAQAAVAKRAVRDKLIEHRQYIEEHGEDMPEIVGWRWAGEAPGAGRRSSTEGDNV